MVVVLFSRLWSTKKGRRKIVRHTTVDTTNPRKKKIECCWRISMSDEEERPEAEAARSSSLPRCSLARCCSFLAARGRSKRATRFAVGEGPTKDEVYWRNLRPEVRKISLSLFYWRAKCPQHPPPGLCASPFCFFARARDA